LVGNPGKVTILGAVEVILWVKHGETDPPSSHGIDGVLKMDEFKGKLQGIFSIFF